MQEIKKMGVLSVAKIEAALCAVIGLIVGIIMALVGTAIMSMMGGMQASGAFGLYFGVASIIILPIVYGVLGFIFGAIIAFLYNIIAGAIGGIEMELVQK